MPARRSKLTAAQRAKRAAKRQRRAAAPPRPAPPPVESLPAVLDRLGVRATLDLEGDAEAFGEFMGLTLNQRRQVLDDYEWRGSQVLTPEVRRQAFECERYVPSEDPLDASSPPCRLCGWSEDLHDPEARCAKRAELQTSCGADVVVLDQPGPSGGFLMAQACARCGEPTTMLLGVGDDEGCPACW